MSKEHKRSLFAFLLVALACLAIVTTGLRSNAVQGILRDRAADVVAGSVLSRIAEHRPTPAQAPAGHPVRTGAAGHLVARQPAHQRVQRPAVPARQDATSDHDARTVPADAHAQGHARAHGRSHAVDHGRHLGWGFEGFASESGHDRGHGHAHAYARGHARP